MAAGEASALVTLFALEGGGPRPPGAQMLFTQSTVAGFLSGGCVESDVALHAAKTLADGEPRRLVYGEGAPWPDIRLLCGARIELLVERLASKDAIAGALLAAMDERRPVIWRSDGKTRALNLVSGLDRSVCIFYENPFGIARRHDPVLRVIVIGGDPIALATASLAAQVGYEAVLVRPKGPEAPPPFASVAYSRAEPAQAMTEIGVDRWTAVVVATHDWNIDQAALEWALASPAGYVGVLGARRRLPERLARLRLAGIADSQLSRLKAPIGLDLGGKAPWEVAVAIIAEIIADRRK
jgi:xanthine dehydrogenase accessory factor